LKKNNDSEDEISTGLAVEITELGDYVLEVGYVYNSDGNHMSCNSRVEFTVIPSNKAIIQEIVIEDFSNSNTVQIVVSGDGSYSFSLDGVNYQDNNIFNDVLTGFLTAFVRDNKGCGITQEQISVMGYPKFFTPNGDGINDFWRIVGISDQFQSDAFITIYDRFGMLVAQISGEDQGWNGTNRSKPLPASDYWFKVNLGDGRLIKGHFALKR
jgi:gliding motility-associated-like protein